jgi:helix-turn-helix protein
MRSYTSRTPNIPGYFSEREEAERLGIGLVTLRHWRRAGHGPSFIRIGRRYLYPHDADEKWIAEQRAGIDSGELYRSIQRERNKKRVRPRGDRTAGAARP